MSISPETAEFTAKISALKWRGPEDLGRNIDYNLAVGLQYLKFLEELYDGNIEHALIGYNWGMKELSTALKRKTEIPVEHSGFAALVLKRYDNWKNPKITFQEKSVNEPSHETSVSPETALQDPPAPAPLPKTEAKTEPNTKTAAPPATIIGGQDSEPSKADLDNRLYLLVEALKALSLSQSQKIELGKTIMAESVRAKYDPLFVATMIMVESSFQSGAKSPQGKLGLMQIHPDNGAYISKLTGVEWRGAEALIEPAYNLRFGLAYLRFLDKVFAGNRHYTLIAYNWGAKELIAASKGKQPIPEAHLKYAHKVSKLYAAWLTRLEQRFAAQAAAPSKPAQAPAPQKKAATPIKPKAARPENPPAPEEAETKPIPAAAKV
jgi:soluble lytic murein transglycosylase-like protein